MVGIPPSNIRHQANQGRRLAWDRPAVGLLQGRKVQYIASSLDVICNHKRACGIFFQVTMFFKLILCYTTIRFVAYMNTSISFYFP